MSSFTYTAQRGIEIGGATLMLAAPAVKPPSVEAVVSLSKFAIVAGSATGHEVAASVAISGNSQVLAIGAPGADAVHIFDRVNGLWNYRNSVALQSVVPGERAGASVALSFDGAVLLVGSENK